MIVSKLDAWVLDILRDPLDKSQLSLRGDSLVSDYGRIYPVSDGVFDLRPLSMRYGAGSEKWRSGQNSFEKFYSPDSTWKKVDYAEQKRGVEEAYQELPIVGRCLDVGGEDGKLRAFLQPGQEYVVLDPYASLVRIPHSPSFRKVYPFADDPMNFLIGIAEHLPFASQSFDTVHMRSCLDHFLNPELAIWEAFRVLRTGGQLIVGLYVVSAGEKRPQFRRF
jgi:ubiquinone/menaquinone biosynthesis C-methylase UbiE